MSERFYGVLVGIPIGVVFAFVWFGFVFIRGAFPKQKSNKNKHLEF